MIRRTSTGWRVEGAFPSLPTDTVDDLGHALVLADLLAEDTVPGPRPSRPPDDVDEATRLRASVRQLEHALASRVVVEQAIGVLSERWNVAPRDAFDQLRRATRSRGLRIHDLARQVVESAADQGVVLPSELVQRGTDRPPGVVQRGADRPPGVVQRGTDRPPGVVQRGSDRPPEPVEPGADQAPEPRQSPDGRGRERRTRRSRSSDPVPAQANGGRPAPVQSASPHASNDHPAHSTS